MAWSFLVVDGFDHYAPADAGRKWRTVTGSFTTTPGPVTGSAARFAGGGNWLNRGLGPTRTSLGASCWLRVGSTGWGGATHVSPVQLVRFDDPGATIRQALWVHPDGALSVRRGATAATVLASAPAGTFPLGAWVYLEYSSALSVDADGRCDVYLDGALACSATGLVTAEGEEFPRANDLRWGNCDADGNTVAVDLDDLAQALGGSSGALEPGAPPWGGPHTVVCLYPVGPGDADGFTPFTPVGAATGWACNAEPVGDGDTTYVTQPASTVVTDLYAFDPPSATFPALPEDFDDPTWPQYSCELRALAREVTGSLGGGSVLYRFVDETATDQEREFALHTHPDAGHTAYWYGNFSLEAFRSVLETLQAGWSGAADSGFRGSQLVVELWYPVAAPPPPTGGGQRWSVGWVG